MPARVVPPLRAGESVSSAAWSPLITPSPIATDAASSPSRIRSAHNPSCSSTFPASRPNSGRLASDTLSRRPAWRVVTALSDPSLTAAPPFLTRRCENLERAQQHGRGGGPPLKSLRSPGQPPRPAPTTPTEFPTPRGRVFHHVRQDRAGERDNAAATTLRVEMALSLCSPPSRRPVPREQTGPSATLANCRSRGRFGRRFRTTTIDVRWTPARVFDLSVLPIPFDRTYLDRAAQPRRRNPRRDLDRGIDIVSLEEVVAA